MGDISVVREQTRNTEKNSLFHEDLNTVAPEILSDPVIQQVAQCARQAKVPLYLVGGAIRDTLLGRVIKDYDFVVPDASQTFLESLERLLQASVFPMGQGKEEQVYRLVKGTQTIDIAVMGGDDINQDLMRRDFTINAIAYDFAGGKVFAVPQAQDDLKSCRIDLVSLDALERDPLRMLRAVRYQCTLPGFTMTERLQHAIARHGALIATVAPERITGELDQIILSPAPAMGLRVMHALGLLCLIFPELVPLEGLPQGRYHKTDALAHTVEIVGEVNRLVMQGNPFSLHPSEEGRLILGYAALFHDLGKPATKSRDEAGDIHFYGHPQESSRLAQEIMQRLRFATRVRDGVVLLVENHMRILTLARGKPLDKALRRLIHTMGEKTNLLLLLGLAETGSKGGEEEEQGRFMDLCRRISDLYETEDLIAPEPLLRGRDLLALGFSPGPRMGEILAEVKQEQIAGELRNTEEALAFVRDRYRR
jgi:poly(A) polymerase